MIIQQPTPDAPAMLSATQIQRIERRTKRWFHRDPETKLTTFRFGTMRGQAVQDVQCVRYLQQLKEQGARFHPLVEAEIGDRIDQLGKWEPVRKVGTGWVI